MVPGSPVGRLLVSLERQLINEPVAGDLLGRLLIRLRRLLIGISRLRLRRSCVGMRTMKSYLHILSRYRQLRILRFDRGLMIRRARVELHR